MSHAYDNFDLSLTRDGYVEARSKEGEIDPVRFQLDRNELDLARELVEQEQADPGLVRSVGRTLHRALFPASILAHYESSRVAAPERRLCLRLQIEPEELAGLPWEFLHDGEGFIGLQEKTPIVRYTPAPQPVASLQVTGPLRVLVVISSPDNYPDLDRDLQADELKRIFGQLQAEGLLEVEFLLHATYAGLLRRLRGRGFHVLHYLGYSAFDAEAQQPVLLFEEENGLARKVSADVLDRLLDRANMEGVLRLMLINDCEHSAGPTRNYALGVARELVRLGLPAVLAMQYRLPDAVLRAFAADFYQGLAEGLPIDAATTRGRARIQDEIEAAQPPTGDRGAVAGEWGAPVLFTRADDGQLFRPQQVRQLSARASDAPILAEIEELGGPSEGRLARTYLDRIWLIIGLTALVLIASSWHRHLLRDPMFLSVLAVAYGCILLLRNLMRKRVPDTFSKLWRRGLVLPKGEGDIAPQYHAFLKRYNILLRNSRGLWGGRALGLVVTGITCVGLWYPRFTLASLFGILILLMGYVLGTQLWQMIATVIATRRLSKQFDLDVRPTRPDGCGGLRPLGDLYFANAAVVLLGGLVVAAWVLLLSASLMLLDRHVAMQYPQQAVLVGDYILVCREVWPGDITAATQDLAGFEPRVCGCMSEWRVMKAVDLTPRGRCLFCIVDEIQGPAPSGLIYVAWRMMPFYPWLPLFQALLVIIGLVALFTFLYPMIETHRLMRQKEGGFQQRADSLAREIAELERYMEQFGPATSEEAVEIDSRLEWLAEHYEKYNSPPLWPFDARVRFRMVGSLGTMGGSLIISEIVSRAIAYLDLFRESPG